MFAANEDFFDKFLRLRNETDNANFSCSCILQGQTLIRNFSVCIGNMIKIQIIICFRKRENIFQRVHRKKTG